MCLGDEGGVTPSFAVKGRPDRAPVADPCRLPPWPPTTLSHISPPCAAHGPPVSQQGAPLILPQIYIDWTDYTEYGMNYLEFTPWGYRKEERKSGEGCVSSGGPTSMFCLPCLQPLLSKPCFKAHWFRKRKRGQAYTFPWSSISIAG